MHKLGVNNLSTNGLDCSWHWVQPLQEMLFNLPAVHVAKNGEFGAVGLNFGDTKYIVRYLHDGKIFKALINSLSRFFF